MFMHNFCSCYIKTNLTLYIYLFIDIILIYNTCMPLIYVDMHLCIYTCSDRDSKACCMELGYFWMKQYIAKLSFLFAQHN